MQSIGKIIKELRLQHGYKTQKDLAEVTGITRATLSRIEADIHKPQPETLLALSKFLPSTTYGELMEKAGYLAESESRLIFDEHQELDRTINKLLVRIINIGGNALRSFQEHVRNLDPELFNEFLGGGLKDLYSFKGLKDCINFFDMDVDRKLVFIEKMNSIIESSEKSSSTTDPEEELQKNIELTDDELFKKFNFTVDGEQISEREFKRIIAYLKAEKKL